MAIEVNKAGAHPNALNLTPRQIFGLWLTVKSQQPKDDFETARVIRAAKAPDDVWVKWAKDGRI